LNESVSALNQLIENEIKLGTPSNKIVLAGFYKARCGSHNGLRYLQPLAGFWRYRVIAFAEVLAAEAQPNNRATPIFMAHGSQDRLFL